MSPSRRDLFVVMAGGALSLAATAPIMAADLELTEHVELLALRDAAIRLRDRSDVEGRTSRLVDVVIDLFDMRIMECCPHDRSAWRCNEIDSINPRVASFTCPTCRASWTFPHIDGGYAGHF